MYGKTRDDLSNNRMLLLAVVKDLEIIAQLRLRNTSSSFVIADILPGAELEGLAKGDTVKILY